MVSQLFPRHRIRFILLAFLPSLPLRPLSCSPDDLAPEIGQLYGGGVKYFPIWNRMTQIRNNAQLLREAFDAGQDPINVQLDIGAVKNGKAPKGTHLVA
jgi:hypothetical protein